MGALVCTFYQLDYFFELIITQLRPLLIILIIFKFDQRIHFTRFGPISLLSGHANSVILLLIDWLFSIIRKKLVGSYGHTGFQGVVAVPVGSSL